MLRACYRVLKPGGVFSFVAIALADGLSTDDKIRAHEAGPQYVSAGAGYPALLRAAGFEGVDLIDATDEYRQTLSAWIREWDAESSDLERILGADEFAERQARRRLAMEAIRDGLLRRSIVSAARP